MDNNMSNRKITYFNLISLILLLLYMALHLLIVGGGLDYVQSSGGGFSYVKIGFFGPHMIDINGIESGSLISPSIVMAILLFFNFVFLLKQRFAKHIVVNIVLLVTTLLLYHLFLNDLNSTLELAVKSEYFWFRDLNLLGYEFIDKITDVVIKGHNCSTLPIVLSIIYNISALISQGDAAKV